MNETTFKQTNAPAANVVAVFPDNIEEVNEHVKRLLQQHLDKQENPEGFDAFSSFNSFSSYSSRP